MDFAFTPDQMLLKNSARAFLDEHCKPATVRLTWDDPRGESEAMWKEMAQLGWLGLPLPEEHGGSGLGLVETAILLEEPGRAAEGLSLFLVDPAASGLSASPVQSMDPGSRLTHLTLDRVPVRDEDALGAPGSAAALLGRLLRRGAVGAAAEMLGAARRCLDMAVGYAKVREQFGQPIGSFQAIRHKCSD